MVCCPNVRIVPFSFLETGGLRLNTMQIYESTIVEGDYFSSLVVISHSPRDKANTLVFSEHLVSPFSIPY